MIVRVGWGVAEAPTLLASSGPIVVIDALRMSATAIVALHRGMTVVLVATPEEALRLKEEDPSLLTAGERAGAKIPELDLGNSPTQLLKQERSLAGRSLALTTGNGVPALLRVKDHAHLVLVGSPLNLRALTTRIKQERPSEFGLLLSGRNGEPAKEDAMTATLLLKRLGMAVPDTLPRPLPASELEAFFLATESAKRLIPLGYEADVRFCAKVDRYPIVPELRDGRLVR
jgi:2-phosphosulfolactate phosphatase